MKRNAKPKKWIDAEVQLLLKLWREGAGAVQIASASDGYISLVKRVAENLRPSAAGLNGWRGLTLPAL
jgi:hypothetical protein